MGESTRVRSPCPSVSSYQTSSLSLVMLTQNPLLWYPEILGKDALAQRAWNVHSTGSDERRLQDAVQPPQLPGESSSSPCFALRNPTSDAVSSCFNSCLTALGSGRASGWSICVGTERRMRRAVRCPYSALSVVNSTDSRFPTIAGEYNSWFKRRGWHAVLPWHGYQGWVRRREWCVKILGLHR